MISRNVGRRSYVHRTTALQPATSPSRSKAGVAYKRSLAALALLTVGPIEWWSDMSSTDDPGADLEGSGSASQLPGGQVHTQLIEALVLLLIEKGVLTRNDALSIIQTVAQVTQGEAVEGRRPGAQTQAALQMLQRMYVSFEALGDRLGIVGDAHNVHQLRPPIYGDRLEFPQDD